LITQAIRTLIHSLFETERNALNHTIQKFEERWGSLKLPTAQIEEVFEGVWDRQKHFEERIIKLLKEAL